MSNNIFRRNFGGYGRGLIELFGLFMVMIEEDTFENNGENLVEITNYYQNKFYKFIPEPLNINKEIFYSYSL